MANFMLSADGFAVARLVPQGVVSASTLNASLINGGFTVKTGSAGSLSVQSYNADFRGGSGGAEIKALYDLGAQPGPGQKIEWVQVGSDNAPIPGFSASPWLDNANDATDNPTASSLPFYTFTAANRTSGLAANDLNFYDFSTRDPSKLKATDTITWNANLYPVLVDGSTITVENGISWGWTLKKATVGTDTGVFLAPSPGSAVVTGVGTSHFTWGTGQPDVSSLDFTGGSFDTTPGTRFKLGTLTYHNGTIALDSAANSVEFDTKLNFTNVPEDNSVLKTVFDLVNTPNTDDPIASADTVTIGSFGYTFNVLEGATASVDIFATLSTGLVAKSGGVEANSLISGAAFDPSSNFTLTIVGLANPSTGGFVVLQGDAFDNTLIGTSQSDTIKGLAGNDYIVGGGGADNIDGGPGFDLASWLDQTSGLTLNLANQALNAGSALGNTVTNVEAFYLTAFVDSFTGGSTGVFVYGFDGNDKITGSSVSDIIDGGPGADTINAGGGFDYVSYYSSAAGVTLDLKNPANNTGDAKGDVITNAEAYILTSKDDTFVGTDSGQNIVFGYEGNDTFKGGFNANNWFFAGDGNDRMVGGGVQDLFVGGNGADTIVLATPKPIAGSSVFDFTPGTDVLEISRAAFGLSAGYSVSAGSTLVSGTGPVATTAQPTFFYYTNLGLLYFDPDGTGSTAATLLAQFDTHPALTAADFHLV